ncbi:hypothetical protein quinque_009353 [Culex quinquefasciatus]
MAFLNTLLFRLFFWKNPWDPRNRLESFKRQLTLLKWIGLWPPLDGSDQRRLLYRIYGWTLRIVFLYAFTLTQVMFFLNVETVQDLANALYALMTQLTLIVKLRIFCSKIDSIQVLVLRVRCSMFHPQCDAETKEVLRAMNTTWFFGTLFHVVTYATVTFWAISPALKGEFALLLPSWFPFEYRQSAWVYGAVWFYQTLSLYICATFNVATDTMIIGLISHIGGQVGKLGVLFSKMGHVAPGAKRQIDLSCKICNSLSPLLNNIEKLAKIHGEPYAYLIELILFHKEILRFAYEVVDIFNVSIFSQIMASVIIICMTALKVISDRNVVAMIGNLIYLLTMICQILQFCYVGNDISYSTGKFNEMAIFSNYPEFNKTTARAFLIYLTKVIQPADIKVGKVFKFSLTLSTFLWILKTSYSYFAVLNSVRS